MPAYLPRINWRHMANLSTPDVSEQPSQRDLDRRVGSGIAWMAITKWGSQIVSWASLLLLQKFLTPFDFGLLTMTTILFGLIQMVSEFGIDGVLLVAKNLPQEKITTLHTVSSLLGLLAGAIACASAPLMAHFFRTPQLLAVVPVFSISFLVSGFRVVPQTLLLRDLRFRRVSIIEVTQTFTQATVAVLLAWLNFRYWALVWAPVIAAGAAAFLFWLQRPVGFIRPNLSTVRSELHFSRQLIVARITWFLYSNSDFAVAGRTLGPSSLGLYSMAWNISSIPVEKITAIVSRTAPSILNRVQHDTPAIRRYVRILTESVSLLTFPVAAGIALVARPLVEGVFDPKWHDAVLPLQLLAAGVIPRCIVPLVYPVLMLIGEVGFMMWLSIITAFMLPLSFLVASRWGPAGIAGAWLVYPLLTLPLFVRMLKRLEMPAGDYLKCLKAATVASAVMVAAVCLVESFPSHMPALGRLATDVLAGAASYTATILLFFRSRLVALRAVFTGTDSAVTVLTEETGTPSVGIP